jgi:hypothetical protein
MNRFKKLLRKQHGRRKAAIRLAIESLEDRAVPTTMMTSMTAHVAASAALSDKAGIMATMPGLMQIIDRAPAAAQSIGQLSNSPSSKATTAIGSETALDNAASDAAWIDTLMQQYSAAQGTGSKDRLGMLIETDGPTTASSLADRLQSQGQHEMKALHDALAAEGYSQHDLDRMFGRDTSSDMTLVLANLSRQDQTPSFLSQLPFLSVTGQDPIQIGSAHQIDPRTTEDADASTNKKPAPAPLITGTEEAKGADGSTKVTVDYKDGTKVQVTLPKGSDSATTNAPAGVSVNVQVSDGTIKSVTAMFPDGTGATIMWGNGAANSGPVVTIDWMPNKDGIARLHDDGLTGNVVNVGHVLHTGGTVWVIMPNPDAEDSRPVKPIPGVSGDTGLTPVGVGGAVDPMDPDHHHTVDIDKLARGIVTHAMSTVNPNPNGPSVGGDEGGGLPGYHGPVDYDNVHNIANVHPGGKPTIILGPPAGPKGGI